MSSPLAEMVERVVEHQSLAEMVERVVQMMNRTICSLSTMDDLKIKFHLKITRYFKLICQLHLKDRLMNSSIGSNLNLPSSFRLFEAIGVSSCFLLSDMFNLFYLINNWGKNNKNLMFLAI